MFEMETKRGVPCVPRPLVFAVQEAGISRTSNHVFSVDALHCEMYTFNGVITVMYGYMTLSDGTGIAHSEMKPDNTVKVYFEKPVEGGFHNATCWLPEYRWEHIEGFSDEEVLKLNEILKNNAHKII